MIVCKSDVGEVSADVDGVRAFKFTENTSHFDYEQVSRILIDLIKRVEALEKRNI